MAAVFHGHKECPIPGTAVPLATGPDPVFADWILFQSRVLAGVTNVGEVRVGGVPNVADAGAIPSGSGIRLSPGDSAVAWPTRGYDLRTIFLDADTANDGVQYAYAIL